MKTLISSLALLLSTGCSAFAGEVAHAGDVGFHPATAHGGSPAVDASALRYGHPASPLNGTSADSSQRQALLASPGAILSATSRNGGTPGAERLELATNRR